MDWVRIFQKWVFKPVESSKFRKAHEKKRRFDINLKFYLANKVQEIYLLSIIVIFQESEIKDLNPVWNEEISSTTGLLHQFLNLNINHKKKIKYLIGCSYFANFRNWMSSPPESIFSVAHFEPEFFLDFLRAGKPLQIRSENSHKREKIDTIFSLKNSHFLSEILSRSRVRTPFF